MNASFRKLAIECVEAQSDHEREPVCAFLRSARDATIEHVESRLRAELSIRRSAEVDWSIFKKRGLGEAIAWMVLSMMMNRPT